MQPFRDVPLIMLISTIYLTFLWKISQNTIKSQKNIADQFLINYFKKQALIFKFMLLLNCEKKFLQFCIKFFLNFLSYLTKSKNIFE